MSRKAKDKAGDDGRQSIEELRERYASLHERRIEAKTNLENARKRLEELKEQARQEYGTDDLEELKVKLREMEDENERKRSEYQQSLDRIEADLQAVEDRYRGADAPKDA